MARAIHKLSALAVNRAKAFGYYGDGGGLYLRVGPTGAKSWVFRFKEAGRAHEMGLGALHTIPLTDARELAYECRRNRLSGINPIEARRAGRDQAKLATAKAMSFREAAKQYLAAHRAGWRSPRHAAMWEASIDTYVNPVIGALPVAAIDLPLVMKVLEPLWNDKTETASRVRGRIEAVLGWATTRGYRTGDNPARWRGHLENLLPKPGKVKRVERFAAMPYAEIGAFMVELRQQKSIAARALEFAILTAARTGEVIGARWDEINMTERLWTVPAERMKAGREHRVPLSDAAMVVLDELRATPVDEYVFPGVAGPLNHKTLLRLLERMQRTDITVHGFRSTFRDWAAERTSFPAEVAEMALAHSVGSAVEQAYRRSDLFDRRRRLMDDWAGYCAAPAAAGEVVAIGRRS